MEALIQISQFCNRMERVLNKIDYVPIVSSVISAPIRALEATFQGLGGGVVAVVGLVGSVTSDRVRYFNDMMLWGADQFIQGTANAFRASVAVVPVVGNVACGIWDLSGAHIPRLFTVPQSVARALSAS